MLLLRNFKPKSDPLAQRSRRLKKSHKMSHLKTLTKKTPCGLSEGRRRMEQKPRHSSHQDLQLTLTLLTEIAKEMRNLHIYEKNHAIFKA